MEDKIEENPMKKYRLFKTEKGKPCYLENDKNILHFSQTLKNEDKFIDSNTIRTKNKVQSFFKIR